MELAQEEINLGGIHEWREVLWQARGGPHNQSLPGSQVRRAVLPAPPAPSPWAACQDPSWKIPPLSSKRGAEAWAWVCVVTGHMLQESCLALIHVCVHGKKVKWCFPQFFFLPA